MTGREERREERETILVADGATLEFAEDREATEKWSHGKCVFVGRRGGGSEPQVALVVALVVALSVSGELGLERGAVPLGVGLLCRCRRGNRNFF